MAAWLEAHPYDHIGMTKLISTNGTIVNWRVFQKKRKKKERKINW